MKNSAVGKIIDPNLKCNLTREKHNVLVFLKLIILLLINSSILKVYFNKSVNMNEKGLKIVKSSQWKKIKRIERSIVEEKRLTE